MSLKSKSIGALFVALVIILAISPRIINNVYSSILGRIFLIGVVIFFAMNNTTLGLLVALAIITASNQFGSFVEGMENETPTTVGDDNVASTGEQKVLTKSATETAKKKISDLKQESADGTTGVDKEDIKAAIMSKPSNSIPIGPDIKSSEEVSAATSGMLKPSASSLEGFSSYAPVN